MLDNTGERIILECETPYTIAKHFIVYEYASGLAKDKHVLDIGTGTGYGASFLADFTRKVYAIDKSSSALDFAKGRYLKPNLVFITMQAETLCFRQATFDVVCAFQVIEHLKDTQGFLYECKRVLKEGGLFFCSTPNRYVVSKNSPIPKNIYHIKEYNYSEFKELLKKYFKNINLYSVDLTRKAKFFRRLKKIGLFNFLPASFNPVKRFYAHINTKDFIIQKTNNNQKSAQDFLAVCQK